MLPIGIIVIWRGPIANIPNGWHICDGTLGTPDLRDRFVIGAGTTYNPDDTGGSLAHNHTFTGDGHTHDIPAGDNIKAGTVRSATSISTAATGTTDATITIPPFYALAYIMRI